MQTTLQKHVEESYTLSNNIKETAMSMNLETKMCYQIFQGVYPLKVCQKAPNELWKKVDAKPCYLTPS